MWHHVAFDSGTVPQCNREMSNPGHCVQGLYLVIFDLSLWLDAEHDDRIAEDPGIAIDMEHVRNTHDFDCGFLTGNHGCQPLNSAGVVNVLDLLCCLARFWESDRQTVHDSARGLLKVTVPSFT